MHKVILSLILSLGLAGCWGGALVAGTAAGGVAASSGRTFKAVTDDEAITYHAYQAVSKNAEFKAQSRVVIVVYNRNVLILGETPKLEWRTWVNQQITHIPQVRHVYNKMVIGLPISMTVQGNDGLITANVKSRMLATTNLKSRTIKVVTEDGTVYLIGIATHEQANIAVEVARNSTGVKRVVKVFEYLD